MHGLVSLIEEEYYQRVEDIWGRLKKSFNLEGILIIPFPHFSWQVAEDYDFDLLEQKMEEISLTIKPFVLYTAGLGIFTGEKPVIFIAINKNNQLIEIHKKIWEMFNEIAFNSLEHYKSENWIPHISIAYEDVSKNNIGEVMRYLAFENFYWKMKIDNLAFIFEPTGEIGKLKYRFKLQG